MNMTSKTTSTSGTNPKIVFFGNERIATGVTTSLPVLHMLRREGYEIVAIVASDAGTQSRKARELEVETFAREHSIPFLKPGKLTEIKEQLRSYGAALGVLVAYGKLVPESIIELFPRGIVNIHPSALPQHRGSIPVEAVILDGSTETAVSLMSLVKAMDAGPVYAQTPVRLVGDETKQALADTLLETGAATLKDTLPMLLDDTCKPEPQDHAAANYDERISKTDGEINLEKAAAQLAREVRAYLGWPGSRTVIAGKDVVITAAHVADNTLQNVDKKTIFVANKQLCLQTADGILVIDELRPAGKAAMPAAAFLAGHHQKI